MSPLGKCPKCGKQRVRVPWRMDPPSRDVPLNEPACWGWMLSCPKYHLESFEVDEHSDPPTQRVIDEAIRKYFRNEPDGE